MVEVARCEFFTKQIFQTKFHPKEVVVLVVVKVLGGERIENSRSFDIPDEQKITLALPSSEASSLGLFVFFWLSPDSSIGDLVTH